MKNRNINMTKLLQIETIFEEILPKIPINDFCFDLSEAFDQPLLDERVGFKTNSESINKPQTNNKLNKFSIDKKRIVFLTNCNR